MATQPQDWEAIKALFAEALELDPAERAAFLLKNSSDPFVRAEVERLLAEHDQARTFLSTPVIGGLTPNAASALPMRNLAEGALLAGRFRIVRFIASGGMGVVYKAEDSLARLSAPSEETTSWICTISARQWASMSALPLSCTTSV